jgi:hypothetical protein
MTFQNFPPREFLEKHATHAAWSPFFDQDGNFVRSIQVGAGCFDMDGNGKVLSGQVLQYAKVHGYDSGYVCVVPFGEEPPPPPRKFDNYKQLQDGGV